MTEKIECAAILGPESPPIIYTGDCHGAIFSQMPFGYLRKQPMGFKTTHGRFVDRVEGLEIAQREGQIVFKHTPLDILLSEDLIDWGERS